MNRWVAAVGTGLIAGVVTFALVFVAGYGLWGCDEGVCARSHWWHHALRWGIPAVVAVAAGWWGAARAERTSRSRERLR